MDEETDGGITPKEISAYIDSLLAKGLTPKTINCHMDSARRFYHYMGHEEGMSLLNPVKKGYALRLARPLPRYLKKGEVDRIFEVIKGLRDHAIFMLMLRFGLWVEEVTHCPLSCSLLVLLPLGPFGSFDRELPSRSFSRICPKDNYLGKELELNL